MTPRFLTVLASIMVILEPMPGLAQADLAFLNAQLKQAVDAQDWQRAIQTVDKMVVSVPQRAIELRGYRAELQRLLSAGVKVPKLRKNQPDQPIRVQLKRRDSGIAVIDVRFNRQQQFEMAVDSGASLTVITRPMAAALGLTSADVIDQAVFMTASGRTVMPIVYVDVIEVGSLATSRIPVAIAGPEMTIGLLGQDFLRRYDVSFRGNVIEFSQPVTGP